MHTAIIAHKTLRKEREYTFDHSQQTVMTQLSNDRTRMTVTHSPCQARKSLLNVYKITADSLQCYCSSSWNKLENQDQIQSFKFTFSQIKSLEGKYF